MRRLVTSLLVAAAAATMAGGAATSASSAATDDTGFETVAQTIDRALAAHGRPLAVAEIEGFTLGSGRPLNRLHRYPGTRWVPNDPRREWGTTADGLSYTVDVADGATTSGLTAAATHDALNRAVRTWRAEPCLAAVDLVESPYPGTDPDVIDGLLGAGGIGTITADVAIAGWVADSFFEALEPGGGTRYIAVSLTLAFIDPVTLTFSDVNRDGYRDSALNEIYFNDRLVRGADIFAVPWAIDAPLPALDVESVGLHEFGHSLGFGHFGSPPVASMNRGYDGIQQELEPIDHSQACSLYARWPTR
jgi:hypothetical protein